jgi:hypothetical protein
LETIVGLHRNGERNLHGPNKVLLLSGSVTHLASPHRPISGHIVREEPGFPRQI